MAKMYVRVKMNVLRMVSYFSRHKCYRVMRVDTVGKRLKVEDDRGREAWLFFDAVMLVTEVK